MSVLEFGHVITAMVTPFDKLGEVNYQMAESLADYLISNGSDGIVVCGTTGESPTLSWHEEYELFKVVKATVGNRGKVIAGTGSNSTSEAIEATVKAAQLGLDGSLQVVPYYNKPPQSGLYQHFQAIAQAVPDLPIMMYNIPSRTGQNILPETVAKLAKLPNIVAIKEASGSLEQACQISKLTGGSLAIYAGDDTLALPILTVGGVGIVSVASHLVGKKIQEMIQAFFQGRTKEAVEINVSLLSLFKVLFCTTNPIPIKAALKLKGWDVGGLRLPLCELEPEQQASLEQVLQEFKW